MELNILQIGLGRNGCKKRILKFILTGQDILTVGVTSAMFSGVVTASTILKKNLMKELLGK